MRVLSSFLVLLLFLCVTITYGQENYNPLQKPNSYRSTNNPNYWKNKKPTKDYWQQDMHYQINAKIDEKTDIIEGSEKLEYWNNSPHDLSYVYFHLYQNAFQPGSYYDELQKSNGIKSQYGEYESQKKGTEILKLQINGVDLKYELDNTILKVQLPKALLSHESIIFDIDFKTYYDKGSVRRRMKKFNSNGFTHYDGVHWYPRVAVYDRKFGWTTDQHLGREFYGDFGTFDVELNFASNYVVGATGFLTNRDEVLPKELRDKLDISNFKDKIWNSKPSEITVYDEGERKTWKYHAENVHDFAFTADPTYRIGEAKWKDKTCIALVQESHAAKWQNAAEYTAKIIQTFSEDIGMYTYHKMIVADARDGMEYPMLTLDGGKDPGYRGLFVHEVAHNWFFGQIGTNETYRASMDEGFTQFLTAWGLSKIDGDTIVKTPPSSKYKQKFKDPTLVLERSVYRGYLRDAIIEEDPSLNTHSDDFQGSVRHGGGYGHVYYKTATMLYNLQYVLGDELFLEAMQHYFTQWKIAHPYFEDFRSSIINYTRVDLNWFFDQWFESSKNIDYAIKSVKKGKEENEYIIDLKRKGKMQMPLDIEIISKTGESKIYHIPNNWNVREGEKNVLHKWIGWGDKLNTKYHAHITVPGGIKNVIIDPSRRMADVNLMNNSLKAPISLSFDHRIYNIPDRTKYEMFARPDVWYNAYDGLKIGAHINGNYLQKLHKVDLTAWYNSGIGQQDIIPSALESQYDNFSYRLTYETPTTKILKRSHIFGSAKYIDGLSGYQFGYKVYSRDRDYKTEFYTYFKSMYRNNDSKLAYLLYQNEWISSRYNNTLNIGVRHRYKYHNGRGSINVALKSTSLGSDYDYSSISLTSKNRTVLKRFVLSSRVFAQYGFGDNWAPESQLYLAGANPEKLMENKFARSSGIVPQDWVGYGSEINHFHQGGGLNLRGYAGYLAPHEVDSTDIRFTYKGMSGLSINEELEFDKYLKFRPRFLRNWLKMKTYLFTDAGLINYDVIGEDFKLADVRWDAGIGTTLTIKKWGPLEQVNPLTIRIDFPLFLNRIPAVEDDYFAFRWVVGIKRVF